VGEEYGRLQVVERESGRQDGEVGFLGYPEGCRRGVCTVEDKQVVVIRNP
jgi:hypothetical protein